MVRRANPHSGEKLPKSAHSGAALERRDNERANRGEADLRAEPRASGAEGPQTVAHPGAVWSAATTRELTAVRPTCAPNRVHQEQKDHKRSLTWSGLERSDIKKKTLRYTFQCAKRPLNIVAHNLNVDGS